MKSEINRIYDKITPSMSSEEVTTRVLERAGKAERKRPFRPVIAAAAAAVTVCAATVAAGAVNDWDYLGIFEKIFGERSQSMSENIISKAEILENTFADVSFEVVAAAADPTTFMIVVDSYGASEQDDYGFNISPENYSEQFDGYGLCTYSEQLSESCVRTSLYYSSGSFSKENYLLTISRGAQRCVIRLAADYSAQTVQYNVGREVMTSAEKPMWIEKAEISAISAHFSGVKSASKINAASVDKDKVFAVTADGKRHAIKCMTSRGEVVNNANFDGEFFLSFDEPLDPNDITAIDFGTDVLELK